MHERWRYKLPCGHHPYQPRPSNPPEERYHCLNCGAFHPEDALIDKKHD